MAANMYDTVKKAIQDIVSPDLRTLEGRFDTLSVEIKRLDEKIGSVKEDVQNLRQEVRSQRDEFRLAIDIHERLASLEARIPH